MTPFRGRSDKYVRYRPKSVTRIWSDRPTRLEVDTVYHMASPLLRRRLTTKKATKKKTAKKAAKKATKKTAANSTKKTAKKRMSVKAASTLKDRVEQTISMIHEQIRLTNANYWDVGKALLSLRKQEIWQLYAETTYRGFLEEHVMPYSTARRMLIVAESYPKTIAEEIGCERGYQLARLARADPKIKKSAEQLWKTNAKLGGRRVRDMSAAEVERLVRGALLRSGKTKRPDPTPKEASAYAALQAKFAARLELEADFDLDLKKRIVRIELSLDDLLE